MTTIFKINDTDEIACYAERTRNGFRHRVEYIRNGHDVETAKVCYLNRTWESYEFQTAISRLLEKMKLPKEERERALAICSGKSREETNKMFGSIAAIAQLGEIFGNTQKEKNDWKARMLKAGLGEGLDMPEDWNTLSEAEKEQRLNNVIKTLKE